MTELHRLRTFKVLALALGLSSSLAWAQGSSVVIGTVTDAATHQPVPDVVVTATSPSLQGEQVVVTDAAGSYRVPQLPPGVYTIRMDKEHYRPYARSGVTLRLDQTVRLNVDLLPEAISAEEIVVVGRTPTVDVGSTSTGVNVGASFLRSIAMVTPGGKGAAARSFESVAELAPGANADTYGISVNGATSPENQYVVDGVSVNDPGFGLNGTPLSLEFIQEVNVISGGYLPEYGRSTGGVVNAVTKSGSNEFHGSVFGNLTPGVLSGAATEIRQESGTVSGQSSLWNLADFGAELGGPILKDKLWFYAGVAPSFTRYQLERTFNAIELDSSGQPSKDELGFTRTRPIAGTTRSWFADARSFQYIGKLTFLLNADHNVSVSVIGTPTVSGGPGRFSISERTGLPEVAVVSGEPGATATQRVQGAVDTAVKWSSSFLDKHLLFDATLGWHHQDNSLRAADGNTGESQQGLAGLQNVTWQRTTPSQHSITDFEALPDPSVCASPTAELATLCPVLSYLTGGPGILSEASLDRFQGKAVFTYLARAAGTHVLKAGLDLEQMRFKQDRAISGGSVLREADDGSYFVDYRQYGYLVGPDQVEILDALRHNSVSSSFGAFVQDSWSVLDLVTVNLGLRYDSQVLTYGEGQLALGLYNEWSPRLGVIFDPTRSGRAKLYASYARYYESIPLDLVDRSFPGEPGVRSYKDSTLCNPLDPAQQHGACTSDAARLAAQDRLDPSSHWEAVGAGATIVDPAIQPQSTDEIVAGGEYELLPGARIGATYTRRHLVSLIEDMSRDDGATYFIGNPGSGFAKDFVQPARDYDALTLFFQRGFAEGWMAQVSYTLSYLRGNVEGLFRSDTGQLDPNINSDFDLVSLLPNRFGPLPADRTHQIKAFGSKSFAISPTMNLDLGVSYRAASGTPYSYLGAHQDYGPGQAFILPRGSAGRLPWNHRIDGRISFNYRLTQDVVATASMDIFNIFNFQAPVAFDQNYTLSPVRPIVDGTVSDLNGLKDIDGNPIPPGSEAVNKNFGNPTAYQSPRSIRFGVRLTF